MTTIIHKKCNDVSKIFLKSLCSDVFSLCLKFDWIVQKLYLSVAKFMDDFIVQCEMWSLVEGDR